MTINNHVDREILEARAKLMLAELSLKLNTEEINHFEDYIPSGVLARTLIDKSVSLIQMYKSVRKELTPLKYHPKIVEDYLSLGDAYFDFRLACMNKANRLAERN
ncbi:MAG: hypothetical protein ACP5OA_06395 [Candidatus Woesearchaeota archaeon]